MWTDGQTDVKLIVAFRNFANASENRRKVNVYVQIMRVYPVLLATLNYEKRLFVVFVPLFYKMRCLMEAVFYFNILIFYVTICKHKNYNNKFYFL